MTSIPPAALPELPVFDPEPIVYCGTCLAHFAQGVPEFCRRCLRPKKWLTPEGRTHFQELIVYVDGNVDFARGDISLDHCRFEDKKTHGARDTFVFPLGAVSGGSITVRELVEAAKAASIVVDESRIDENDMEGAIAAIYTRELKR